jgi:uncharacterized protein (TIGR03086 family)
MTMQNWTVITESLDLLEAVAAAVTDATGQARTPCAEWTAAQVLQHAAGDQLAWAAAIGFGTGPAENPFAPSGHLDGSVDDLIKPALAAARAAWETVKSEDDAVPTPLPQGPLPAAIAAGACALDAAVHAWDIAAALGRHGFLPDELARQLLPAARAVAEPLRAYGAYAAALPPRPVTASAAEDGAAHDSADDDGAAELLRYLGRDPHWSSAAAAE